MKISEILAEPYKQTANKKQGVTEGLGKSGYKEIEFVCANPKFPAATDPELQKQMHLGLQQIPGVIPLLQDQSEYSEGQCSLAAIYKDRSTRSQILKLAKRLGVQVDLEQPVSDDYVDRAIRGEHYGQQLVAEASSTQDLKPILAKFLPFVQERLGLDDLPEIELLDEPLEGTFGRYGDGKIRLMATGRHPIDVLRTLAHELIHYKQDSEGRIKPDSGETGSPEENEANAGAGIIMRDFDHANPELLSALRENFKDGRNPQDKGDSKRHGINTKASVSSLRKTAKQGGRKGQLAHWLANMKAGRAKKR